MPKKLAAIESLRGIAALSIVLFHFDAGSHLNNRFTENAWLMVDFFFLLSGFVIALGYFDRLKVARDVFEFQAKRFLRLYPLHFVTLLVWLGIETSKYFFEQATGIVANNPAFSSNNSTAFLANLLLLQNWTLPDLTFNYPSWAISALFYTYLLYGFVVVWCAGSSRKYYCCSFLIVLTAGFLLMNFGMGTDNVTGPARCLFSFFLGTSTCVIFQCQTQSDWQKSSIPAVVAILLTVFVVALAGHNNFGWIVLAPFVFAATILVVALTSSSWFVERVLGDKRLVYLGTISFAIYLIHPAVWWCVRQVLRFVLETPTVIDSTGRMVVEISNRFYADLVTIVGLVCILALAHLAYVHIEQKITAVFLVYSGDKGV